MGEFMRRVWLLLLMLLLVVGPSLAHARAGGGYSFGSRGMRTYSAPRATPTARYAAPIGRSLTPNQSSGFSGPARAGYGSRYGSGFGAGLMGGLIGAGIGGMLMGHGFFGGGLGFGGFLGLLIQIGLVVLLVRWLMRRFMVGQAPGAGAGGGMMGGPMLVATGGSVPQASFGAPQIGPADYQSFEAALAAVQAAWSAQDLQRMRQLATPEMVGFFAEQLADQASRGQRNNISNVRLERGDLSESWQDNGRDYATVAMQFSMLDATYDRAGQLVDGSESERVTVTELWTFLRAPGGQWLLSAIQQTS